MNFLLEQAGYKFNGQTAIWARPSYGGIAYNDGDEIETRLAAIVTEVKDISVLSSELRGHCADWPSSYHLGASRANVLRPFEAILKNADVLEIGAGCGAITRYLGEVGANVLALEGAERRASIARSRTRDLDNVTVVCERFDQLSTCHKFDVVTLIGVLEYSHQFMPGDRPDVGMLRQARRLLKPDGVLILAIENQLGLKYFAGAPEDHVGIAMYGIESRYRDNQPRTYGRVVLQKLLRDAGFETSELMAAFPDYKFPISIVTREGMGCADFDASAFAWQSAQLDAQLPPYCCFSPELAWSLVFDNALGLDLSNSLLVVASASQRDLLPARQLSWHYNSGRRASFCRATEFLRRNDGGIDVKYALLGGPDSSHRIEIPNGIQLEFDSPTCSVYHTGRLLSMDLIRLVTSDGWLVEEVGTWLRDYLAVVCAFDGALIPHGGGGASEQRLAAGMFDATPQNIVVRADGSHALFDIEWKMTGGVEPAYLVFRGLLRTIASITRFGRPGRAGALTRKDFIIGAMRAAGLDVAENDFLRYSQIEHQIQQEVCGFAFPQSHAEWHSWPLPMESLPTLSEQLSQVNELRSLVAIHEQQIADRDKQIADRDKQITDRDKQIADRDKQIAYLAACAQVLQQRLNDIEHSASWILTLPLRVTVRVSVRILCLCSLAARWLADLPANVRIWSKLPIWFHRNVLRHGGYRRMFDECAASLRREGLLGSVRPGLAGLRRLARSPLDQIETLFTSENGYVFFSGNTRSFVDVKSPLRVWSGGACFELLDAVLLRHTRPDLIRLTANGPHECGFIGIGRWGNLGTPVVDRIELGTEQFRVCAKTPRINLPTILLLPHVLECVSVAFDYDTATNIQHAMKLYPALHGMWRSYLDHVEYNCILDLKKVRNPEFSLIIVLYKNYDFLMAQLHCLAPVFATRCGEVVLIGNELENHEALRLKIMAFGDMHDVAMSLYCSNINSGFAHANNFAASVARSEQLFFMNPDIFPMGNQEDRWTSFFDPVELNVLRGATLYYGNGALMHAGMYGVTEVMSTPVTGEVVDVCRVEHYGKGIAGHPKKTDADPGDAEQLPCRPNLMVSAALWGIRKATYKRLNGLSIDYIFAYYEDADFCLRFLDSGGKIELSKESAFYHFEGIGSTVSGRSKSILWVNRYLFSKSFAKHPSMLSLEEDLDAI